MGLCQVGPTMVKAGMSIPFNEGFPEVDIMITLYSDNDEKLPYLY